MKRNKNYMIQTDQKKSLFHDAMTNIAKLIGDMKLKPGDKLPPEAELVNILNVSRAIVREALSGLSAVGLVESRRGHGTVVLDLTQPIIKPSQLFIEANLETLLEVVQARRIFEVEIAKMAAVNRSEEDLLVLERCQLAMGIRANSMDDIVKSDIDFHLALACCTKNDFLFRLMSGVSDIMESCRRETFKDPTALTLAMKEHGEILEAIKRKDPERVTVAMDQHLKLTEDKLKLQMQNNAR